MGEYHSRELEKQNAEASYTFNPSLKIFPADRFIIDTARTN